MRIPVQENPFLNLWALHPRVPGLAKRRREFIKFGFVAVVAALFAFLLGFPLLREHDLPGQGTQSYSFVGSVLVLPPPRLKGAMSVEEAIHKRRSKRDYSDEPITLEELSQLLYSAQGISEPANRLRTAPSAGGTYPLEIYVVVKEGGCATLEAGTYRYDPSQHALERSSRGDIHMELTAASLDQAWVRDAAINIIVAAVYERTTGRYGDRGVRYVHMEVGHAGQNIYLEATSLGLGTVVIGAFHEDQIQGLLNLSENCKPLYVIPVGRPR